MVTYQFTADDETWSEWKQTVPRDKSLEKRLIELIEADTDGRVLDEPNAEADGTEHQPSDEPPEPVESVGDSDTESLLRSFDLPGTGSKFDARVETAIAFYDYLRAREGQPVSKAELQSVADDHDLDVGYGSFRSFWTNWIKKNVSQGREENTLARLPGVSMDGDEYVYRKPAK